VANKQWGLGLISLEEEWNIEKEEQKREVGFLKTLFHLIKF
jgi:hypothetical protein